MLEPLPWKDCYCYIGDKIDVMVQSYMRVHEEEVGVSSPVL